MKKILTSLLAVGVCLTPITVMLMAQPTWGQTQNSRSQEAERLLEQGIKLTQQQEHQQAIEILQQGLTIARELKDQKLEALALLGLGRNYNALGQKQKALEFYNQALPLWQAMGDRTGEAITLGNIGGLFQSTNRPTEAITNLEQSLQISLEMRRGLQRENRQKFLQENDGRATALVDVLINQKKYAQALEWVNLFTTADLADYTRLINAKVANPEAQKALDDWSKKNQQLESLRQQLQSN